jgi:hypothetical protein
MTRPIIPTIRDGHFDGQGDITRWARGSAPRDLESILEAMVQYSERPSNVLTIDPDGSGDFETIEEALDSFDDETIEKPYAIMPCPGVHQGGFTLRPFVHLITPGFGPSGEYVIESNGKTIFMPSSDCLIKGVKVITTSSTATDAAIEVYQNPLPEVNQSFMKDLLGTASHGARGLAMPPLTTSNPPVAIYAGFDAPGFGDAVYLEGTGFAHLLGGNGFGAAAGVKIRAGGFYMVGADVGLGADAAAGVAIDCDQGFFVCLLARIDDCLDGIKLRTGSVAFLVAIRSLGGVPGTAIDTDPTSTLVLGDVALDSLGSAPWSGWSVLGPSLRLWSGTFGSGSTGVGGPDQRPSGVPVGYEFFALDRAPGGAAGPGCLLIWQGGAWIDTSGAIIP